MEPDQTNDGQAETPEAPNTLGPRMIDGLAPEQCKALAAIVEGRSIRAAAESAGVNRGTVYRWIKTDAYFRAAYNRWQVEEVESCRAALLKCAERAVAKIADVVGNDRMLAFRVAKEMGLFARPRTLRIEADEVAREIGVEAEEAEAELDRRQASALARQLSAQAEGSPQKTRTATASRTAQGATF